ncbi:hypothetical protein ABZT49_31770 [Methylobacterium sp. EM32]|uniref:hypothetical protein n=1 Tax=Methylobacterium sp. EM32 TaxID=3163481 RepID=UPI0033B3AF6F
MPRIFLAALTLACVCSPALVGAVPVAEMLPAGGNPAHGLAFGLLLLGTLVLAVAVRIAGRARLPVVGILVAALIALIAGPALAAEVATVGNTALPLPWGQWLSDLAQAGFNVFLILLPPLAAWAAQAIRRRYIWAGLVLTQTRFEQLAMALAEHGLSAVKGAVKGKQLNVELGSRVVAAGLGRGAEAVPRIVWEQAGGAEGVAKLILRKLDLDEEADERNVLGPALASFEASGAPRSASH